MLGYPSEDCHMSRSKSKNTANVTAKFSQLCHLPCPEDCILDAILVLKQNGTSVSCNVTQRICTCKCLIKIIMAVSPNMSKCGARWETMHPYHVQRRGLRSCYHNIARWLEKAKYVWYLIKSDWQASMGRFNIATKTHLLNSFWATSFGERFIWASLRYRLRTTLWFGEHCFHWSFSLIS